MGAILPEEAGRMGVGGADRESGKGVPVRLVINVSNHAVRGRQKSLR